MRWAIAVFELYILTWFVVVGYEAFLDRASGLRSPFHLFELHHAYIGALLVGLGWYLHSVTGVFIQLLGLVITVDDHIQHIVQTEGHPDYQSPLHQLFARTLWRVPGVPRLVEFLDERWWALILIGLLAFLAFGCAVPPRSVVPMVLRPDTRLLNGVLFDSATMRQTLDIFDAAMPHEASVCYAGELRDTVLHENPATIVVLRKATVSVQDSANEFHVWFPPVPRSGCRGEGLIGVAHDHPFAYGSDPCTHSDPDAFVLFTDPRLLFSLVFCGDGRMEVFYQDGRRLSDHWLQTLRSPSWRHQ